MVGTAHHDSFHDPSLFDRCKWTDKTLTELNSLVTLAHTSAEDKLHYKTFKKPMFVTCSWCCLGKSTRLDKSMRILVWCDWRNATPSRVTARNVRGSLEVRALPRHKEQLRDKMRWSMSDCCGTNWNKTQWTCRLQDPHTATTLGALLVDAKGVFGTVSRSESAGLSAADKHSAVETVSLHEPLTRSRTRLRWLHSDVNVSDWSKKFDHRAVASFPEFLQRRVWEIVFHPTFTSDKKLRGQGRVKKPPVVTPEALGLCWVSLRCDECWRTRVAGVWNFLFCSGKWSSQSLFVSESTVTTVYDGCWYHPGKSCMKLTVSCVYMLNVEYNLRHVTAFPHDTTDVRVLMDNGANTASVQWTVTDCYA